MPHPDAASPIHARTIHLANGNSLSMAKMGDRGSGPAMTHVL
ncbi:hypothetical protein [Rhodohalobacter sp. 8-1]